MEFIVTQKFNLKVRMKYTSWSNNDIILPVNRGIISVCSTFEKPCRSKFSHETAADFIHSMRRRAKSFALLCNEMNREQVP